MSMCRVLPQKVRLMQSEAAPVYPTRQPPAPLKIDSFACGGATCRKYAHLLRKCVFQKVLGNMSLCEVPQFSVELKERETSKALEQRRWNAYCSSLILERSHQLYHEGIKKRFICWARCLGTARICCLKDAACVCVCVYVCVRAHSFFNDSESMTSCEMQYLLLSLPENDRIATLQQMSDFDGQY